MQNGASQAGAGAELAPADDFAFPDDALDYISRFLLFMRTYTTPQRNLTERGIGRVGEWGEE